MANQREFEDQLREQLRGLFPGTAAGLIAFQNLSGQLWRAATDYPEVLRDATRKQQIAVLHVQVALEIQQAAEQLVARLRRQQAFFREAIAFGYLRGWRPGEAASLNELVGRSWAVDRRAQEALAELADSACRWSQRASVHARKPGRLTSTVQIRRYLAKLVAMVMADAKLPLAKSKNGLFANVLKPVYRVAALSTRDVYRDVAWAVEELCRDLERDIAASRWRTAETKAEIERLEAEMERLRTTVPATEIELKKHE